MRDAVDSAARKLTATHCPQTGAPLTALRKLDYLGLGIFLVLLACGAWQHAMVSDEVRAWLITSAGLSIHGLYDALRYDGHPILWYLLLWPVTAFTTSPEAMKLISVVFAAISAVVFVALGPWTRGERWLWPVGYYVLFEYGIKSRSYAVGMALLMMFCALWPVRQRHIVVMAIVLGLMANTHVYFTILSFACALALAVDRWRLQALIWPRRAEFFAAGILVVGALLAVLVAAPPSHGDWSEPRQIDGTAALFRFGDLIWPQLWAAREVGSPVSFSGFIGWEAALALAGVGIVVATFAGLLVALLILRATKASPPAFTFLVTALVTITAAFWLGLPALTHHSGMLVLSLTAGVWLLRVDNAWVGGNSGAFCALLICQALAGVIVVVGHFSLPYGAGKNAADWLRQAAEPHAVIAGSGPSLTTVCGYLARGPCFHADRRRFSSYLIMDGPAQMVSRNDAHLLEDYLAATRELPGPVYFLLPEGHIRAESDIIMRGHGFLERHRATGAVTEHFVIYRRD